MFVSQVSADRMNEIYDTPTAEGSETFAPKGHDIVFDHVSFAYDQKDVLRDVSFTAREGEVTALVGPSGSGKSTCARLAARLWDVSKGSIRVGGVDISAIDPEALLRDYSMVFQDVVLFDDTVMENIRLGRRGASDEEVRAAARAANCEEFVRRLPMGYDTPIGENGARLSGGERQRISIARALLKDAPITRYLRVPPPLWTWKMKRRYRRRSPACWRARRCWSSPTACAPWRRRTRSSSSPRARWRSKAPPLN